MIAVLGFYVAGGDRVDGSAATQAPVTGRKTSTKIGWRGAEVVQAPIVESTTWRAGSVYRLDGLVFVEGSAHLVIEPGVTVLGGPGAALIVTRDASIHARGTADEPIVFTSAKPDGERASGDWGGVALLGNAPINRGQANIEGIPPGDTRSAFGGNDRSSNCGVLEYVRIEFAGTSIGTDNEMNGLTLGGCGSATLVHHVQVHRGHDDGVEIFGGTADLRYILVSHARDDAFDWDMGWTGRAQFLIVQQHPGMGDAGFEGDNWKDDPEAKPVSRPQIHNVTMVGSRNPNRDQRAMVIRHGSGGEFRNFLITGFPRESIDLRGELTAERVASKMLSFGSIAMSTIGPDGLTYFTDESGAGDDDGGFDERRYFSELAPDIFVGCARGPRACRLEPDRAGLHPGRGLYRRGEPIVIARQRRVLGPDRELLWRRAVRRAGELDTRMDRLAGKLNPQAAAGATMRTTPPAGATVRAEGDPLRNGEFFAGHARRLAGAQACVGSRRRSAGYR